MDEAEWGEVVEFLRAKFVELGHFEIADIRNYEVRESSELITPSSRDIAFGMLKALDRELAVQSPELYNNSLLRLKKLIDTGEAPSEVVIWANKGERVERLVPLDGIPDAQRELKELIKTLADLDSRGEQR